MSVVNIISAIGNNSSIYPLIVRDCGIEVPSKIAMTYNQNLKESKQMAYNATRERFIDEYGTSIVWLGGIPLMNKICDWGIKKMGFDPKINPNLLNENSKQGLKLNIAKFKNLAPEEIKNMEKVLANKSTYQKLLAGKFVLSTAIPIAIMGYFLPKLNFALTEKLQKKQDNAKVIFDNLKVNNNDNKPAFKGMSSTLSNMSTLQKMAITDGGLTIGRVSTARNKYEKLENGFKMTMMMFLNFIAPVWIAKGLDNLSGKIFNTNVNLDPKLLNDKEFLDLIKNNNLELPQNDIINFLDTKSDTKFAKMTEKYCGVKYLKNRVRDPREYVDEKKVKNFQKEIENFAKQAKNNGNIENFAKKALRVKSVNILANVGISSFLLAITLPKITFILRKKVTGSDAEPGLIKNV